jgi:hypothetical protein
MKQLSEGLDSKLGVGMKDVEDAIAQIEANQTLTAVTTLVTTRSLGFCAAQIYFQVSAQRNPVYCDVYAFYCVNLSIFETRLTSIRSIQEAPYQRAEETYTFPQRPEYVQVTKTVNAYPDQVGRFIASIGPVTEGEGYYVPALAANRQTQLGVIVPQSEHITLSNLRETVVALAEPATNPQVREAFYRHNPIPGTRWRVVQGTHVLENPDDVIPEEYNVEALMDDIDQ